MPELKRGFEKGKMNKDLDERLLPSGEYKHGLNIEVTTSESSNVGAVENLIGNYNLNTISYHEPFYDGLEQAFDRDGYPMGYNYTYTSGGQTGFSSNAEVVGTAVDDKTKKIYSLIARVLDYGVTSVGSYGNVETGIRSDAIVETPKTSQNSTKIVFSDIYEVKRPFGVIEGGKRNTKTDPTATTNTAAVITANYTEIRVTGTSYFNYLNGIKAGMTVQAVLPDGTNLWETNGTITVITATPHYADPTSYLLLRLSNPSTGTINLTAANLNAGAVLKFSDERLLNFEPSSKISYTDTNGSSVTSPTPIDNKITGINTFDGLLYFTDGKTEPKKINIENSKRGTLNANPYHETKFVYENHLGEFASEKITLEHITVIKRSPLNPPVIKMRNTQLKGQVNKIGVTNTAGDEGAGTDFTSFTKGSAFNFTIAENVEHEKVEIALNIDSSGNYRSIKAGDKLVLKNNGYEVYLEVTDSTATTISTKFIEANALYLEKPPDQAAIKWEASLYESNEQKHPAKAMWEKQFIRIAYRWKYEDGEVSALSPFSEVCFLPRDRYGYSSKDSYNTAMINDLRELTISNFLPLGTPKDVVQVDIVAKEDKVPNLYLLKTIKKGDYKVNVSTGLREYEFDKEAFEGVLNAGHGRFVATGSALGSVLPSDQLLRPFDSVPRTAVAQTISASRLIYGNYKANYDLKDAANDNIELNYNNWRGNFSLHSDPYKWQTNHSNGKFYGYPALKSGRSYSVGMVYKDRFGRESSVVIGDKYTLDIGYQRRDQIDRLRLDVAHNAPSWAEYFKFFIKESSAEFYNIPLQAHYPCNVDDSDNASEVWLSFSSADRNKVQEGDFLILKKGHSRFQDGLGGTDASISNMGDRKYKILDISNEVPDESIPDQKVPSGEDKAGKFFAKIKIDRAIISAFGVQPGDDGSWRKYWENTSGGRDNPNPAIFEVEPRDRLDIPVYYEVPRTYPVKLKEHNVYEFINPGDRIYMYYRAGAGLTTQLREEFMHDPDRLKAWYNLTTTVVSVAGPEFPDGPTAVTVDTPFTLPVLHAYDSNGDGSLDTNSNSYQNPGTVWFIREDGSFATAKIWHSSSEATYGASGTVLYVKPEVHNGQFCLPFSNCFKFGNGVESNRIQDDFNAPLMENGVKVSTTSDNYKEEDRGNGLIFSGIYNSKNGVNNLNQFISSSGITKDLNPQFGSIQILNARDTNITTVCEHKTVKVLANKDALFTASGANQVTSTKNVLGQTVPYAGEFGIGTLRSSFVNEEFRSYFVDPHRNKVLRLSNDGLTAISDAGMGDYFGDALDEISAAVGSYNRDKGEYDLTLHYDVTDTSKTVETISYSEFVKGWTSFKSYVPDAGVSLDSNYYTMVGGLVYLHAEKNHSGSDVARCNYYGTQYKSSITTIFNDAPDTVKSFQAINYEGTQSKIIKPDVSVNNSGSAVSSGSSASITLATSNTAIAAGQTVSLSDGTKIGVVKSIDSTALVLIDNVAATVGSGVALVFSDNEYYNNTDVNGWSVESIITDKQRGSVHEFKEKEGKWFNYIHGDELDGSNLPTSQEFNVQGLGRIDSIGFSGATFGTSTVSITTTLSGSGSSLTNPTSFSGTIQNGVNQNTLGAQVITLTAPACGAITSANITVGTLPTGVFHVNVPAGQTIMPGSTIALTVTLSSAVISSNVSYAIPIEINLVDVCQDHEFQVTINQPVNYTYDISGLSDYSVFAPSYDASGNATFNLSGQSQLYSTSGAAQETFSVTFTAQPGYVFFANDFDPTEAFNTASHWSYTEVYTYNGEGQPTAVTYTYSYEGQADNPDPSDVSVSAFDLVTFPSPTMNDGNVEVEEPVIPDSLTRNVNVVMVDSATGSPLVNASVQEISAEVMDGNNQDTLQSLSMVITPNLGFDLVAAADFTTTGLTITTSAGTVNTNDVTVSYSDGAFGTVLVNVLFGSLIISEDVVYTVKIRESNEVTASTSGQSFTVAIVNTAGTETPILTAGTGYSATQTINASDDSGGNDVFTVSSDGGTTVGTTQRTVATVVIETDSGLSFGTSAGEHDMALSVDDISNWEVSYALSANSDGDANGKVTYTIKYTGTGASNTFNPVDTLKTQKVTVS